MFLLGSVAAECPESGSTGILPVYGEVYGCHDQSACPNAVHRIVPDLVLGQGQRLARLQPAWLSRGSIRTWSEGAAGPGRAPPASELCAAPRAAVLNARIGVSVPGAACNGDGSGIPTTPRLPHDLDYDRALMHVGLSSESNGDASVTISTRVTD